MSFMKTLRPLYLAGLVVVISACTTITSNTPLGVNVYTLDKDDWGGTWVTLERAFELGKDEWEGNWVTVSESFQITVTNYQLGELEINFLEDGKINTHKVYARKSDKDSYLNLLDDDGHYLFAKFKINKKYGRIIIWVPIEVMIEQAFKEKELTGEIKKGDIWIKSDEDTLNKFFSENRNEMLFAYEDPIIFIRLAKQPK